jgi:hypothetical protein
MKGKPTYTSKTFPSSSSRKKPSSRNTNESPPISASKNALKSGFSRKNVRAQQQAPDNQKKPEGNCFL